MLGPVLELDSPTFGRAQMEASVTGRRPVAAAPCIQRSGETLAAHMHLRRQQPRTDQKPVLLCVQTSAVAPETGPAVAARGALKFVLASVDICPWERRPLLLP